MTIWLTHGIHTSRTSRRLADLAPLVEKASGIKTKYFEYGNLLAVQTRFWNPGIAERLAKLVEPGDILVGHSNGVCISVRALMLGAPAVGLVALNGALKNDFDFDGLTPGLTFIHAYYNDDDGAVPWAQRSPKILLDPLWGDLGHDGYKGTSWKVRQFDCEHTTGMPALRGHSAILNAPAAEEWAGAWASRAAAARP